MTPWRRASAPSRSTVTRSARRAASRRNSSSSPSTTSCACLTRLRRLGSTGEKGPPGALLSGPVRRTGPNLGAMASDDRRTDSGIEIKPVYSERDLAGWDRSPAGRAGVLSLHPRHLPDHVPGPALDHPAVFWIRHGGVDQRTLAALARRGRHRLVVRLRPSHPDGLRLRPPTGRGRGGKGRRGHRLHRRHAHPAERPAAGPGHHVDDDQRHRRHPAAALSTGGRGARGARRQAGRHHPKRHPQGVRRPRHLHLPAAPFDAPDHRHLRLLPGEPAQLEHHLHLGLSHPRSRIDRGAGDRLHAGQRHCLRGGGHRRRAWRSTSSPIA